MLHAEKTAIDRQLGGEYHRFAVAIEQLLKRVKFVEIARFGDGAVHLREPLAVEVEEVDAVVELDDLVHRLLHRSCLGTEPRDVHGRHEEDSTRVVLVTRDEAQTDAVKGVARNEVRIDLALRAVRLLHHARDHALILLKATLVVRGVDTPLVELDALHEQAKHVVLIEILERAVAVLENGKRERIADLRGATPLERGVREHVDRADTRVVAVETEWLHLDPRRRSIAVGNRLRQRDRWAEEIALHLFAADFPQELELCLGLDPLGERVHPELLCHVDDGADDNR